MKSDTLHRLDPITFQEIRQLFDNYLRMYANRKDRQERRKRSALMESAVDLSSKPCE
jgi:hypothetical protein